MKIFLLIVSICMISLCICFYYLTTSVEPKQAIRNEHSNIGKWTTEKEYRALKGQRFEEASEITCFENITHHNNSEFIHLEQNFMSLIEAIQKERQYIISKTCLTLAKDGVRMFLHKHFFRDNVFYSSTYKVSVCHIKKCGFSSWIRSFAVMQNFYPSLTSLTKAVSNGTLDLMKLSWKFSLGLDEETRKEEWQQSIKVMLVRHPFSRIVSAYHDKMIPRSGSSEVYKRLSTSIYSRYKNLRHNPAERTETGNRTATFEDFVRYLVTETSYDGHWKLFDNSCSPCLLKYDYIAKFETLYEDMIFLRKKFNLSEEHAKAFFPNKKPFKTDAEKVEKEFSKIPKELSKKLYEKYKRDFDLFGYELPAFL